MRTTGVSPNGARIAQQSDEFGVGAWQRLRVQRQYPILNPCDLAEHL